ncbi:isoprenylcysteine carboxylmethyltransferase family protein [Exiguobacterium sp. s195]|uniref:methyltransferase family protein n=1 Tax=Exiguobacterium sp. s195 TaxID=2751282 RepID=UPI001BE594F4|nr:isoprenylcysteine carboxylmethyltransferase family protein [Exiguobacterium sp. s195]
MYWMDLLLIVGSFFWLVETWQFRNRKEASDGAVERKSFYFVATTMIGVFGLSLVSSFVFESQPPTVQRIIGLTFYIAGVSLRYWGILHLRHQFTRHVVVRPEDELVSSGPYRYLRHPLYTGLLLIAFGFSLYFIHWGIALIGAGLTSLALLYRIRIEEGMLIRHFGQSYQSWSKTRKRLFPFIY